MVITRKIHVYEAGEYAIPYAGYFIKCKENGVLKLQDAKKFLKARHFMTM